MNSAAMTKTARFWIDALQLEPHPEGGYFLETYRSQGTIPHAVLPPRYSGPRSLSTAIYYLLEQGDYSAFHRITSDEVLHFYAGGALEVHMLNDRGHTLVELGHELNQGQTLQCVVPAGSWFAMAPKDSAVYSLIGCTVSPGFDFADFELASAKVLLQEFPAHAEELLSRFPPRTT
jgi:predicted cupin superfamily sugar epimerase